MLNPVLFRQYESSDMNKISNFSRFCLILHSERCILTIAIHRIGGACSQSEACKEIANSVMYRRHHHWG